MGWQKPFLEGCEAYEPDVQGKLENMMANKSLPHSLKMEKSKRKRIDRILCLMFFQLKIKNKEYQLWE